MKTYLVAFLLTLSVTLVSAACTRAEPPAPARPDLPVTSKKGEAKSEWDTLVEAAQKEGSIVIYANGPPKLRDDITTAFRAKYGITTEFLMGRPDELVAKIKAERNAGLYMVDLGVLGATPFINEIKPAGIAEPIEPMLLLPEVKDPKGWRNGALPFVDAEKSGFAVTVLAVPPYHRNLDLVKEGEITTSPDLLNPKWREKLALLDPSNFGSSNNWFTWTIVEVMGRDKGLKFMRDLAAQKPLVTRDDRQLVEGVARGKFAIGIGPSPSIPASFIQMKAPIDFIDLKEPRYTTSGFGVIEVFKKAPHPNAARLFVNWLLSKEGSAIFAVAAQYPSARADVSVEGIGPALIPRAGDINPDSKYQDYQVLKAQMLAPAAEIFGVLRK